MSSGVIRVRKVTVQEGLAYYIALMPLIFPGLISFFGFPNLMNYTMDVAWVALIVIASLRKIVTVKRSVIPMLVLTVLYLLYTLTVYLLNFQSPFYYLWGFRNNFRFLFAFLAFTMFCREEDIPIVFRVLELLFWVNAGVSLVQFFFLGLRQDYLGGIFGQDRGSNGSTIVFFAVVIAHSLLSYLHGEEGLWKCGGKCLTALLLSAMAELKFFLVLFLVILIAAAAFTKFSWKKTVLVALGALFFGLAAFLLTTVFGEEGNLSWERMLELAFAENYATSNDLGRLTAIPTLRKTILTTLPEQLFGMGLGNCETSSFAICNTPFYQANEELHYTWFTSAMLFLETGFIGLLCSLSFFVICFFSARKRKKKAKADPVFCELAMILSMICFVLVFYNAAMRKEIAYFAYFILALPFASRNGPKAGQDMDGRDECP